MTHEELIRNVRVFFAKHGSTLWLPHPDSQYASTQIIAEKRIAQIAANDSRIPIDTHSVRADTSVHSQVWVYKDHAVVELAASMNRCWKRFCIVKEIAHILFPDGTTIHVGDALPRVKLARDSRFNIADSQKPIDAETCGIYSAIELLLPWSIRGEISDQRMLGKTNYQIAERYLVPMAVIDQFFDLKYAEISAPIHLRFDRGEIN